MPFDALEVSLEAIHSLRVPLARIRSRNSKLHDQIERAASSVPMNLAEGRRRNGKDRIHLWRVAAGSADEIRTALRVALAFGYVQKKEVEQTVALLDRVLAMIWRMTH